MGACQSKKADVITPGANKLHVKEEEEKKEDPLSPSYDLRKNEVDEGFSSALKVKPSSEIQYENKD